MVTFVDEHTREYLAIDAARRLTSEDVLQRLENLCVSEVRRPTSDLTMIQSARPQLYEGGFKGSVSRHYSSKLAAHGRTIMWSRSSASCETDY
jgi:hypothetical protein